MNVKFVFKVIIFTIVIVVLSFAGSFMVPACEYITRAASMAVLVEIGYLVYIKLFGKNKKIEEKLDDKVDNQ